jgi:hypothetical protein
VDVQLEFPRGTRARRAAPQRVGQRVHRHRLVRAHEEHTEQRPPQLAGHDLDAAVDPDRHRSPWHSLLH